MSQLDDEEDSYDSDDSSYSMQLNGKKFSVTKTCLRGTYAFTFLRDSDFLARTKEEQAKFIQLQIALRQKRLVMKERI